MEGKMLPKSPFPGEGCRRRTGGLSSFFFILEANPFASRDNLLGGGGRSENVMLSRAILMTTEKALSEALTSSARAASTAL